MDANNPVSGRISRHFLPFLVGWMGFFFFSPSWLGAQMAEQKIQAQYAGASLEDVLQDLSKRYGVRFAYSPEFIPLQEPVHLKVQNASLQETLDQLFAPLPIRHQYVGRQVVLRFSPKPGQGQLGSRELPEEVSQKSPLYADPRLRAVAEERRQKWQESLPELEQRQKAPASQTSSSDTAGDLSEYRLTPVVPEVPADKKPLSRLAQISLLPYLGTNSIYSSQMSNQVSVNLLWGVNGGVEGLEVGGFVNTIRNDVKGIQLAGWANVVGDDVTGIQYGGLFNMVRDTVSGVQIGGLFNVAGKAYAVQGAGLFNAAIFGFRGVQGAGLFNYCGGATTGIQGAGAFNISRGKVKSQFAGGFNLAGDVENNQISGVLNIGKKVEGYQIGLINFADTVSKASFGLISIIRKGYNRVEIGGSETFFGNFALKLGVKSFYNIFYLGGQWKNDPMPPGPGESAGKVLNWGLGYGLGTAIPLGARSLLNVEALSIHVNEREIWTADLHQLNQLRLTWDVRFGSRASIYLGPTANYLLSRRKDPESGLLQTSLAPYLWINHAKEGQTTHQFWGGLTAGVRI
ncbi:MAG: STN domain-containing protein [Haliscomenobacter sp.]|nr:STN domain-containing protein [Haliscomenobacter sp.]